MMDPVVVKVENSPVYDILVHTQPVIGHDEGLLIKNLLLLIGFIVSMAVNIP